MKNLCMTLTLIGNGTTSVKHSAIYQNKEKKTDITAKKKTIITVTIIYINCLHIII